MIQQFLESPNDPILQEDLENIVNSEAPVDALRNSTLFVTGATGLIGSLIVKTLACYNRLKATNIRVLAFVRNEEKAKNIFDNILDRSEIKLITGDVTDEIHIDENIDYIIHGAGPTASKYFVEHPVETILTTFDGTRNVLELAKMKKVKSMIYLSSMEVYGDSVKDKLSENDLGYIDIHNVRSSYPESKRICECLCAAYSGEYGIPVRIARLTRVIGPGFVDYNDNRILMQFAKRITEKKDITLHTAGKNLIDYCYTTDVIEALLYIIANGKDNESYNVTQSTGVISVISLAQMLVDRFSNGSSKITIDIPELNIYGYNTPSSHLLQTDKIQVLGWCAHVQLVQAFERLIKSINCE